ncbi:hypothetical protein CI109_101836 [Kwoniella shandongensis]|uniref:Uncharacterized protein n=1 Tax=Kwoniella shandongensis TaxID=1734106 RepID=A0A5M6C619_9TREE|nr:uncharacterized protein CI109_001041 [Kwoniella shandongensis]KAA5530241.1 hypothetical protein CI109_001041 [Kwoniella shandongensis]
MPDDLSFLDHIEEWLEAQVPQNLHDLPYKMLETMEKMTNELFETLNIHGPPSISIPFPPFLGKEVPPPPPPPPPPVNAYTNLYTKSEKLIKAHPVAVGAVISVGLGLGGLVMYKGIGGLTEYKKQFRVRRKFGVRGVVEDGMLKEAVVILAPSPLPPLLVPLAASLLRAGYIVLVAVPNTKDADSIERRLSGLEEKSALRVLIYDPDDTTTFPPFHRSLLATLTLRFPVSGKYPAGDPYNPQPAHLPHIHAFLSLYSLNPSPPSQPGGLPALPTLLAPNADGTVPSLINFYPSASVLTTPNTFASQVLTSNHVLLGKNLVASSSASVVSVYVGDINLPTLPAILSGGKTLTRRQQAKERLLQDSSATAKVSIIRDFIFGSVGAFYGKIIGTLGFGSAIKEYSTFEHRVLRIIKSSHIDRYSAHGNRYAIGHRSFLPLFISDLRLPVPLLPRLLSILPTMPSATGPGLPPLAKGLNSRESTSQNKEKSTSATATTPTSASASSSDHEGGEDLASSIHTGTSASSRGGIDSESSGGLEGSWVGLDSAN